MEVITVDMRVVFILVFAISSLRSEFEGCRTPTAGVLLGSGERADGYGAEVDRSGKSARGE
eukprot:scaffold189045_cov31-Attheya_sp.AAC.1